MTDEELDRLLDVWEAPGPSESLRTALRERFPRTERRRFGRPLAWVLAAALACTTLAVGTEQTGGNPIGFVFERLRGWYQAWVYGGEAFQAATVRNRIRASNPVVYVDGQLAGPIEYRGGASLWVDVPGDGKYGIDMVPLNGWTLAGRARGNTVEFHTGGHQIRIVCDKPVTDTDDPVYVRRAR